MNSRTAYIILFAGMLALASCTSGRKFTTNYYKEHELALQGIRRDFKVLYEQHPFSLEFRDKEFKQIGLEILTDSIRYIYSFHTDESNLTDTLRKYHFNEKKINQLINEMRVTHCTWITNLDYYENRDKKQLVFISIRHKDLESSRKVEYFTLAFFDNPQLFDDKKRLLDKADRKKKSLRSINGEIFYKLTDRVCYAFTGHFR